MVEADRLDWYKLRTEVSHSLNKENFEIVCVLHAKYFKHKYYRPCTCNPRVIKQWLEDLNELYDKN